MQVTFDVLTPEDTLLGEQELTADFEACRDQLANLDRFEGLFTLENPDSEELVVFRDVLTSLINDLCFKAVPALASGREFVRTFTAYDEMATFKVEGDVIVITGEAVEEERCPARPLLEALVGCGERFVAPLQRLYEADPARQKMIAGWQQAASRARASLG